jgi:hypothetical protein
LPVYPIGLIERPDDLTSEWLTSALGAGEVTDFTFDRIGTGQMSECYRVALVRYQSAWRFAAGNRQIE